MTESDQALSEGQRLAKEATPAFQQLLASVDSLGLETFRAQQKDAATKTNALLGSAVEQFRLAYSKIEGARKVNKLPKLKRFLELKSQSYDLIAKGLAINQDMIAMMLDESNSALDALLPKLKEAASRRDALEQQAQTVSNEATALGQELQANSNLRSDLARDVTSLATRRLALRRDRVIRNAEFAVRVLHQG